MGLKFSTARTQAKIAHFIGNDAKRLFLSVTNDRCDQPALNSDRDADIRMLVLQHAAVEPAHISVRDLDERECERLDHEVIDRELEARFAIGALWCRRIDLLTGLEQFVDLAIYGEIVMRDRELRLQETLRDRLPHRVMWDEVVTACFEQCADLVVGHARG